MHEAVKNTVEGFLQSADAALPAGYSAVLFGSGARGDYVRGRSDVNLLVVTESAEFARLRALGPALRKWHDASYEPPFLFTRDEWQRATDVYPIEITDMQARYELLRGVDPVAGVRRLVPAPVSPFEKYPCNAACRRGVKACGWSRPA